MICFLSSVLVDAAVVIVVVVAVVVVVVGVVVGSFSVPTAPDGYSFKDKRITCKTIPITWEVFQLYR